MKNNRSLWEKLFNFYCLQHAFILVAVVFLLGCTQQIIKLEKETSSQKPSSDVYAQGVIQQTIYGQVEGTIDEGTSGLVWRGIRFAKSPAGDLRWRPPQEPEKWEGVKEAKSHAPICIQGTGGSGEEDCLSVDIYRPNSGETGLPVYVWIHGGSNSAGKAAGNNLSYFAKEANVVAVAIQYRLGPFGFFKHDALNTGDPQGDSGNYGLLDQMLALSWVKKNISFFGGDPKNVTAAGESAGAHNILSLMMSKYTKGLFQKAIYQSGGMEVIQLPRAKDQSDAYVKNLKLTSTGKALAKELRALDAKAILKAKPKNARFGTIVDGHVIPDSYYCLLEAGDYNKMPIIMGGNRNENSFWMLLGGGPDRKWRKLWGITSKKRKKTVADILTPEEQKNFALTNSITGRLWQAKQVHAVARSMRKFQEDVYVYDFQWGGTKGTDVEFVFGAAHANEIAFFNFMPIFDIWAKGRSITEENKAARLALAKAMRTYYAQFLHTGNPNGKAADLPEWKIWSNEKDGLKTLNLDASSEPGSADLNVYMTKREYRLNDLHKEIDELTDQTTQSYIKGVATKRRWVEPLCTKTTD